MTTTPTHASPEQAGAAPLMLSVSGCRGVVGASFTPPTIARFVASAARQLREESGVDRPRIVLARDGRASGEMAAPIVTGALVAAGCDVIDLGIATTPSAGVMVDHHAAAGAVVVTASHNPQQWNGLKVIAANAAAPPKRLAERIIRRFHEEEPVFAPHDALGSVVGDDTAAHVHVARVLDALERLTPLGAIRGQAFRVVVDPVNASGTRGARLLLEALGCEPLFVNDTPVGHFAHTPEPTRENLRDLGKQITAMRATIGFAQDPDADRLAILDASGHYIGEEYTLALAAWAYLDALPSAERAGLTLAANLSTSRMIDDVAERFGVSVVRTPVGEANLVERMTEAGMPIGGEGNGGVVWPDVVPIRDSLSAMALVLALMARTGRTLADLVADLPAYAIIKRKATVDQSVIDRIEDAIPAAFPGADANAEDGVRVDLEAPSGSGRAWVHVRPSNTEPIIRLIAEAPTEDDANGLLDSAATALGIG